MIHSIMFLLLALLGSVVTVYTIAKALPNLYRQRFIRMAIDSTLHSMRIALSPIYWTARALATRTPGVRAISGRINNFINAKIDGERLEAWCARRFANHPNPLLRGDIKRYAAQQYPIETFPWLWRPTATISADIKRPLIIDGKIAAGNLEIYSNITAKFIDNETIAAAFKLALLSAAIWAAIGFFALFSATTALQIQTLAQIPVASTPHRDVGAALTYKDVWTADERNDVISDVRHRYDTIESAGKNVEEAKRRIAIITSGHGFTTSIALFCLIFMASFRALVMRGAQAVAEPLARDEKSSVVNNKYRFEDRKVAEEAYRFQLQTMDYDKTPMIEIGTTTGVFNQRQSLNGPEPDVKLKYSLLDAATHTLVYGGTGAGKTRAVINPIVRQLIKLRGFEIANGRPNRISFYVTDKKGTLASDVIKLAIDAGQESDLRIVGTGDQEFGIDLLDGLNPRILADVLTSCITQVYGQPAGGTDFWTRSAADAIRAFAILCWAFENTPAGMLYSDESNERPYSFSTIFQVAMSSANMQTDENAFVWEVIESVLEQFGWSSSSQPCADKDVHEIEIIDAITYIAGGWAGMAEETRTSILAHINISLGGLCNNMSLREAFGGAFLKRFEADRMIGIDDAWTTIMVVRIGDHGDAGRLINIFLKSLLFIEAQRREVQFNQLSEQCAGLDLFIAEPLNMINNLFFVADEYQSLATAGSVNSDIDFWNIARSTGVAGIVCTQSQQALEQALGSTQAKNFINQFRSLICLTTEDVQTINHLKELSGKTIRSFTFRKNQYESYAALCAEIGDSPIMRGAFRFTNGDDEKAVCHALFDLLTVFEPIVFTKKAVFDIDYRFVRSTGIAIGDQQAAFDKESDDLRAATWRAEDKIDGYFEKGHSIVSTLEQQDIASMGRAHAYVFLQRHGVCRQDIVRLPV